jgi:DNA-binding NarL/FixJ family response regulator
MGMGDGMEGTLSPSGFAIRGYAVHLGRDRATHTMIEQVLARLNIEVVGRTADASHALHLIGERRPDLFVAETDAAFQVECLACVELARVRAPGIKAVVVSDDARREQIDAAFEAGADAYVLKRADPDDFASAIRQSFESSIYFSEKRKRREKPLQARDSGAELTSRELQILQLVSEGRSNLEVAQMLWVTEQTIKFHLSNVYRKLGVSNRTEASRWAQFQGLLPDTPQLRRVG